MLQGREVRFLINIDGGRELAAHPPSASACALSSASGMMMLAGLPADELEEYLATEDLRRASDPRLRSGRAMREYLGHVRDVGVAVLVKEGGVTAIASPVRDSRGGVAAAVGVSGPSSRLNGRALARATRAVRDSAGEVSLRLGARGQE